MRGRWMTRVGVLLTWLAFAGQAVSATTDSRLTTLQDALYHDPVQADQAVAEALAAGWLEQWRAKLLLATARGKKLHDKRETEKQRDWNRQKSRLLKEHG